jgi:MFS transporter, DHA1 family, tetracycline resistance protein
LASLQSANMIIGPLLMNNLFYFFSATNAPIHLPSAPFIFGATCLFIAFVVAYQSLKQKTNT